MEEVGCLRMLGSSVSFVTVTFPFPPTGGGIEVHRMRLPLRVCNLPLLQFLGFGMVLLGLLKPSLSILSKKLPPAAESKAS
ncbi:hypothetical protein Tco_0465061 [Tanacetum coccineum]